MLKLIDNLLNRITMYRLVVYELAALLVIAVLLGFAGLIRVNPVAIIVSTAFIFGVCVITNWFFAWGFDAPYNPESTWITALILALIIPPPINTFDTNYLALAFWASAIAIASKYILAIRKKHIFNPAAIGVAATAAFLGLSASWWVGTPWMAPFSLVGGLLIVRKIHRFDLWFTFMGTFTLGMLYFAFEHHLNLFLTFNQSYLDAPAFFFSTVMLTEPATSPGSRWWRMLYGFGVAGFFLPNASIGSFFFSPELALLLGNIGTYIVGPKDKLVLMLKERIRLSRDVFEFVFVPERRFAFTAGQYLEWTLAHERIDSRSVRRYFTIRSSPEDPDVRLGVKFYDPPSTFKRALLLLRPGDTLVASQLSGDFTMPKNPRKKLAFIAGGIGITPFASMIEHLIDTNEARDIALLYANKTPQDAVYFEILERARELGVYTVYAFSDQTAALPQGAIRSVTSETIAQHVPDYAERIWYISGPQGMVTSLKEQLLALGVSRQKIKTDYFPGFA